MILRTRSGHDLQLRMHDPTIPPAPGTWALSHSGIGVNPGEVFGLSAASAAVRLVSETLASLNVRVCQGRGGQKRTLESSWQWELLARDPSPGVASRFDFYCDLSVSVEGWGNAFVRKVLQGGEVVALLALDPTRMALRTDRNGMLEYRYSTGSRSVVIPPSQIIHIRGFRVPGSQIGLNPVQLYRHQLGAALALDEYEGDFFRNGASPGGTLQAPTFTREQAEQFMTFWRAQHGGLGQQHIPALLYGGMTWQQTGITLEDAQFIEAKRFTVEQIARMWRVPAGLLGAGSSATTEQDSLRFFNFSLLPRIKRIEDALLADRDLFPSSGQDIYPEFQVADFLRADAATRAEVQHKQIQSGVLLPDEARADEGRPPLPDGAGKIPQVTPVGGAPNPALQPVSSNGDGPDEEEDD